MVEEGMRTGEAGALILKVDMGFLNHPPLHQGETDAMREVCHVKEKWLTQ